MNLDQLRLFSPQLIQLARKHGIAKIFVFGSTARGKTSEHSDIDFLVEMRADASLFGAAGFAYDAEQLLGVRVDVVPVSALSRIGDKQFVRQIQRDAVPL